MEVNKKLTDDLVEVVKNAIHNEGVSPKDAFRTVIHFLEELAIEVEDVI